ncbi:NUDIX hydrolase [Gordonia sp. VNK1]|uniref:NUDIX hydrolase n=1 Tax=Gordonia oleivorans TaxID=3156618 RepID=UPI0032B38F23
MSKSQGSSADRERTSGSSPGAKTIWAAGGVLWRHSGESVEIGLVHRPRYDDWTLPKGKTDDGETLIDTAVREIAEETGHHTRLGRLLSTVSYDLPNGRKHVRYWSAESTSGRFEPNHEVDAIEWLPVDQADHLLSYRLDRKVLREFVRLPVDLTTFVIIRHARAGRRSKYRGDDRLRPLDTLGRAQAAALAPLLNAYGVTELHSADRVRCVQTLEPTSSATGLPIVDEPALSEEAYAADPESTRRRFRELATTSGPGQVRAVCSQGKVIEPLLAWWAGLDNVELPPARNRKGSVWVLSFDDGRLVAADHVDSPLPLQTG